MCESCEVRIAGVWLELRIDQDYRTPDHNGGVVFSISEVNQDLISIVPQRITISKRSFNSTLHYLRENQHFRNYPCEIRSNNDDNLAGPLCLVSRGVNGNVRCINYVIAILRNHGLVGISGNRPNCTWLIN